MLWLYDAAAGESFISFFNSFFNTDSLAGCT